MMIFPSEIHFFIGIPYCLGDLLPGSKPKAALAAATAFVPSQALTGKKSHALREHGEFLSLGKAILLA